MGLVKRDWIVVVLVLVIIGVLAAGRGRMKAAPVPNDERHRQVYDLLGKGGERGEVEKTCAPCHGSQGKPLSKGHPPKEQCLICHKQAH